MKEKKLLRNSSGLILVTVILITIVLSIVVVGVMSLNVGHVKSSSQVVDSIKAEQLATGSLYKYHRAHLAGINYISEEQTLDGKRFTVNIAVDPDTTLTPNNTEALDISVTSP